MKADSGDSISDINIVPLVDIILVVLIIFMVTVPTTTKSKMDVQLPESASGETAAPNRSFEVTISSSGDTFIGADLVDELSLKGRASQEFQKAADLKVLITADGALPYSKIVQVMDWIRSAGLKDISISTLPVARSGG